MCDNLLDLSPVAPGLHSHARTSVPSQFIFFLVLIQI